MVWNFSFNKVIILETLKILPIQSRALSFVSPGLPNVQALFLKLVNSDEWPSAVTVPVHLRCERRLHGAMSQKLEATASHLTQG